AGVSIRPSSGVTSLSVAITSPTSDATYSTDTGTLTLGGVASGPKSIAEVRWSNDQGGSGVCSGTDTWSTGAISLALGLNVITVVAEDVGSNTASDVLNVNYDPADGEAPSVTITSPTSASTYTTAVGSITLSGTASDNVGVVEVTWADGAGGSGVCSGTDSWSTGSISLVSGTTAITVTARDAAGNTATDTITVTYTPEPPPDPEPEPGPGTDGKGDTEVYTGSEGASGILPNVLIVLDTSSSMTASVPTETDPTGYNKGTTYPMYRPDKDRWFSNTIYGPDPDGNYYNTFPNITLGEFPCSEVKTTVQNKGFWHGYIVLMNEWTHTDWRPLTAADIDYCIPSDWPSGTPYPPNTYPISIWMGNYLNYMWSDQGSTMRKKNAIAKEVLTDLVEATFGVRFGYMTYNSNKEGGSLRFPVQDMTSGDTGTRQELIDIINATDNHSGTPLAESQFEAHRYYMENSLPNGGAFFDVGPYSGAESPIENWCQRNYVIHLTDGAATEDTHSILETEIGDVDGDG
nr:hypothetical protein [Anaerolineales bacterium]